MSHNFYSMIFRMKHVFRWGLMRNTWQESLSDHSFNVAILAHALAVIGNKRFGKQLDAQKAAVIALFHDCSEIITGDLPTPVKYQNQEMIQAYKTIEQTASQQLIQMLPKDLQGEYQSLFFSEETDDYLWKLVKGADKLSALIKCIEEEHAGNQEFQVARQSQLQALQEMQLPEVNIFLSEFIDGFTKTLDEQ